MPATASGKSPTAEITENLPPISSGTTKLSYPSALASSLRAPFFLSVVAKILSFASFLPYFSSKASFRTLKAMAGSVVVPDFEITFRE